MDSLHYPVLQDFFRNARLLILVGLASADKKVFYFKYALLFGIFFLIGFTAYEYIIFMGVFLLFWIWHYRAELKPQRMLAMIALPSAFVLAFLLHLTLVAIEIESFNEAIFDRITNAVSRAIGDSRNLGSQSLDWGVWLNTVGIRFPLQAFVFPLSAIVVALVAAAFCKTGENKPTLLHNSLVLAAGLGAAGYAWYLLMPAQCVDHAGLAWLQRHLVPACSVVFGAILVTYHLQMLQSGWKPVHAQATIWALAIAAGSASLLSSELPLTREKIAAEREFEKIVTSLRQTAPYLEYEDYVGMNVFRPSNAFTYYLKSRTLPIQDTASFEKLQQKPKVFLLVPTDNPETQKLADLLSQNYRMAFFAQNNRLPFYVFVKND
jgi:hypothetical protein